MECPKFLTVFLSLILLTGCVSRMRNAQAPPSATTSTAESNRSTHLAAEPQQPLLQQVSLNQADQSQSMAEAMNRKILRNAEISLEVASPQDAQRKVTTIAESLGGFVVTSESKQRDTGDPASTELQVSLVVRVPEQQFGSALDQIRATGSRVVQEKVTGQDVTEEFIDLEARIKTQKALELQFLEIMKQANKVADALEVQRQIADVRTEIEKLEGRKRFLQNRASLSTITVNLQTHTAIAVDTSGFGRTVRDAVADSVNVATTIVLFFVRFVIVMVPIFVLIILPAGLLARYFIRRAKRLQLAQAQSTETPINS